jgi:HAD superfamily hydrolase (TIGR01509 family)
LIASAPVLDLEGDEMTEAQIGQEDETSQEVPIRALIFDMDGLLVDSEPLAAEAMTEFLARFGKKRQPNIQRQMLGRRLPEAVAICQEGYGLPGSLEELIELYATMRLDALRGKVKALAGAHEAIAFGQRASLPMAIATSGMRAHADLSLAETGLSGNFLVEVTGDEVERGKPAPDLFLTAASKLGVDPAYCVVFEDSLLGVEAALAAGMRVIAVPTPQNEGRAREIGATVVVSDLHEAIAWLERQQIEGRSESAS